MRLIPILIFVASACLGGCVSIPLSTAIRLSSMSPRDLALVEPAQVQVRISVPAGFQLDVPESHLSLTITTKSGTVSKEMGLSLHSVTRGTRSAGLFRPDVPVTTYLLALSPEGVDELRALQLILLNGHVKAFSFSIGGPLAEKPAGAKDVTFWAAIKLANDKPFLLLVDGAKLKLPSNASGK